jgi:hypothetical protein
MKWVALVNMVMNQYVGRPRVCSFLGVASCCILTMTCFGCAINHNFLFHILLFISLHVLARLREFLNLPNPSAALGPGVYSASNGNEYQKH